MRTNYPTRLAVLRAQQRMEMRLEMTDMGTEPPKEGTPEHEAFVEEQMTKMTEKIVVVIATALTEHGKQSARYAVANQGDVDVETGGVALPAHYDEIVAKATTLVAQEVFKAMNEVDDGCL